MRQALVNERVFGLSPEKAALYYSYEFESLNTVLKTRTATLARMDLMLWQARLRDFSAARGWEPYLNPKNLCMALSVEAAELLECYQWKNPEEAMALKPVEREAVADEMADVLLYLLQLARVTGIDLEQAAEAKLRKNAIKYPAP